MDEQDLKPADHAILSVLDAGRATKGLIIDESGYSRNTVYQRLEVLQAAEHVRCVHEPTRLFELVDDPRGGTAAKDDEPASTRRETGAVSPAHAALDEWEPADANTERGRAAAQAVVSWLAEQDGPRRKADVVEWAEQREDELAYSPSTLWTKVAKPALQYLREEGLAAHTINVGWEIVEKE
jgi:hypothetical protein